MFDPETLPEIRNAIEKCTSGQSKLLAELRSEVRKLKPNVKIIYPRSTTSVSLVASDGGNNKLVFDPFYVQLVRVVDSYGKQLLLDAVSPSTDTDELSDRQFDESGNPGTPLGELMADLGIKKLYHLTSMIPRGETIRQHPEKAKSSWVQVYRDICEWAVLYNRICHTEFATDTLIVRDGLLRSKLFKGTLFMQMIEKINTSIDLIKKRDRRNVYLVGLAKHSKVIDRYGLSIALEGIFSPGEAHFVRVPREMEEKAYEWSEWAKGQEASGQDGEQPKFNSGDMFFVKFGPKEGDPIWPVDILSSQAHRSQEIFGFLLADAKDGFPIPFYPRCLQRADEYAQVVDLDLDILQDEVMKSVRNIVEPEKSGALDMFLFMPDLTGRRYQ